MKQLAAVDQLNLMMINKLLYLNHILDIFSKELEENLVGLKIQMTK